MRYLFVFDSVRALFFRLAAKLIGPKTLRQFFKNCCFFPVYLLKQCIRKKERLYKLYVRGVIPKGDYTYFKNRLTNLLRRAKRLYFLKMFLMPIMMLESCGDV